MAHRRAGRPARRAARAYRPPGAAPSRVPLPPGHDQLGASSTGRMLDPPPSAAARASPTDLEGGQVAQGVAGRREHRQVLVGGGPARQPALALRLGQVGGDKASAGSPAMKKRCRMARLRSGVTHQAQ